MAKIKTRDSDDVLGPFLHDERVATLAQLKEALGTAGTMTVFRKLKALGYLSSYSHRGAYYTLREIPDIREQFTDSGRRSSVGVLAGFVSDRCHPCRAKSRRGVETVRGARGGFRRVCRSLDAERTPTSSIRRRAQSLGNRRHCGHGRSSSRRARLEDPLVAGVGAFRLRCDSDPARRGRW